MYTQQLGLCVKKRRRFSPFEWCQLSFTQYAGTECVKRVGALYTIRVPLGSSIFTWHHAVLQHGDFYGNGNQYSFMQASFDIIVRNGFSIHFSIRGSRAWRSRMRIECVTSLDIQVSLCNPMAMLEDSMTSENTLYRGRILHCFNYSEQMGICPVGKLCPVAGSKTHGCPWLTPLTRTHTHTHTHTHKLT